MLSIRSLVLFGSLALLGGCAEWPAVGSPCPPPGSPSAAHKSCWYSLKITSIDANKNVVSGTDVKGNNFTFRVRDIEMLTNTNQLQKDQTYVFSGVSNSAYLELYTDGAVRGEMKQKAGEE
jgi:hypothetical protein